MDAARAPIWFLGGWLVGTFLGGAALVAVDGDGDTTDATIGALTVSLLVLWGCELTACALASRRDGTGDVVADFGLRFRPVDLVGLPLGAVAQLALIPVVYWPLQAIWPDTFTTERLEENARDLVDRADGGLIVVLFVLVVLGAPLVEEILYRGLLQRPALTRYPRWPVVVVVAVIFAVIHLRPIEYPGLFAAGLLFGACAALTDRLGMAITAHVGFNLAGLVTAL